MPLNHPGDGGEQEFLSEEVLAERLKAIQHSERFTYRGPEITVDFAYALLEELKFKAHTTIDARLRQLNLSGEALQKIRQLSDDIKHRVETVAPLPQFIPTTSKHAPAKARAPRAKRTPKSTVAPELAQASVEEGTAIPFQSDDITLPEEAVVAVSIDPTPWHVEPQATPPVPAKKPKSDLATPDIVQPNPEWLKDMLQLSKMMSDETRVKILRLLGNLADGKRINVSTMAKRFDMSQPAISHHISLLEDAGYLSLDQDGGRQNFYSVTPQYYAHLGAMGKLLRGEKEPNAEAQPD